MTPCKALYGREPPTLLRCDPTSSKVDELAAQWQTQDQILTELKKHLHCA